MEELRVVVFTSIEFEPRDWSGPTPLGELLTYKAVNKGGCSLTVKRDNQVVFDKDFNEGSTITIDGNVIHLPTGAFGR